MCYFVTYSVCVRVRMRVLCICLSVRKGTAFVSLDTRRGAPLDDKRGKDTIEERRNETDGGFAVLKPLVPAVLYT